MSPLHLAIRYSSAETLHIIFSHLSPDERREFIQTGDEYGWTPLHYAVRFASYDNVRVLMEFGAYETMDRITVTGRSIESLLNERDGDKKFSSGAKKVREVLNEYRPNPKANSGKEKKWSWKRLFAINIGKNKQ